MGIFVAMSAVNVFGQKISGKVADEAGNGIGYVNVGIMNSATGVVSDSRGYFTLTLPDSISPAAEITFSHISYVPQSIGVSGIRDIVSSGNDLEIILIPANYAIEEVTVFGGKRKEQKYTRKGIFIPMGVAVAKGMGSEVGSIIGVKGEILLSRIDFRTLKNTYDKTLVRINVYRIDSDLPDSADEDTEQDADQDTDNERVSVASLVKLAKDMEKGKVDLNRIDSTLLVNILHVPIYCNIPTGATGREFSVLFNENVVLSPGRYYISLEIVEIEGELTFPFYLHNSYIRKNSMGVIEKIPFNIGMLVWGYKLSGN